MTDERFTLTNEELKQRFLELGYEEKKIDEMIEEATVWSFICR